MAAQLLQLEGEHIEVVQNTADGKRGIISDAELDMLLDHREEVFEGRGVGWKSGASVKNRGGVVVGDTATPTAAAAVTAATATASPGRRANVDRKSDLFEVYEAPKDEGNDALAHMLGEEVAA